MLPILVNYSTVIALISKMKNPTVRLSFGDVMMKSVQKANKANIYILTVTQ